ncbi:unnamed protein product [Closterium sp. Naga37s-1]|nr:unnamed protein product [Closterium sp. Naga37s-1]
MAHDGDATPGDEGEFEGDSCELSFLEEASELQRLVAILVPSEESDRSGSVQCGVSNFGIRDAEEEAQRRRAVVDGEMRDDPRAAVLLRFENIVSIARVIYAGVTRRTRAHTNPRVQYSTAVRSPAMAPSLLHHRPPLMRLSRACAHPPISSPAHAPSPIHTRPHPPAWQCAKYREQPELLDPHLAALLSPAMACLSAHALAAAAALPSALAGGSAGSGELGRAMGEAEAQRMVREVAGAACVVQVVAYVRGAKVVCRFFPNAPSHLEPALALLLLVLRLSPAPPKVALQECAGGGGGRWECGGGRGGMNSLPINRMPCARHPVQSQSLTPPVYDCAAHSSAPVSAPSSHPFPHIPCRSPLARMAHMGEGGRGGGGGDRGGGAVASALRAALVALAPAAAALLPPLPRLQPLRPPTPLPPAAAAAAPVASHVLHRLLPLPTAAWEGRLSEAWSLCDVLLRVCLSFLPNGRLPVPLMLARLLSRPEMHSPLAWFMEESRRLVASLSAAQPSPAALPDGPPGRGEGAEELLAPVVLTLAAIFKAAPRTELTHHTHAVWTAVLLPLLHSTSPANPPLSTDSSPSPMRARPVSLLLPLALVKLLHRLALSLLPPRAPSWRYQRSIHRVDAPSAAASPAPSPSPAAGGAGPGADQGVAEGAGGVGGAEERELGRREGEGVGEEEGEEEEEEEVEELVEEAVGELLPMLKHESTDVRWAAARGLSRVVGGLPAGMADEVVAAVIALVDPQELPSDSAWQGVCLALAELAARGLLLPSRLHSVTPLLASALHYEVLRGAVGTGAHVRDAAAYVCWAIAHSFSPPVAAASLQQLCPHLLAVACCDRQMKCRWAAAAAFQEVVGRFGCISDAQALSTPTTRGTPHASNTGGNAVESGSGKVEQWAPAGGIAIVNAADVTSLSSTRTAFTQQPARTTGTSPSAPSPPTPSPPSLPSTRRACSPCCTYTSSPCSPPPTPPSRHGALLATAALLPPLSASPPSPALSDTLSSLTASLPTLLAPRSFRGRLAADLKVACCRLLSALAVALPRAQLPPLPKPALTAATACLHDMLAGDGGELQVKGGRGKEMGSGVCARARFVSSVQEAAAAALWDLARTQRSPACTDFARQLITRHVATLESASSAASARRGAVLALQCFLPSLCPAWSPAPLPDSPGTGANVGGLEVGHENSGQKEEEGKGGPEERGSEGGVNGGEGERSRHELAERVVKALCAAATDNRGRRAVTDVAVRAAAVEALGNAASIIPLLQAGGAGARGHAGTGGGDGAQVGQLQGEEGEKEEVEGSRQGGLVGRVWWEEGGEGVVTALLRAAQDYTEDQRGDVGRLVREASMKALVAWVEEAYRLREVGEGELGDGGGAAEASLPHGAPSPALPAAPDASSSQQRCSGVQEWCREVAGRVVGVLLKQAGEKIDGTREVAGQGLLRLLWGRQRGTAMVGIRVTREEAGTAKAVETRGAGGSTKGASGGGEEERDGGGAVRQGMGGRAEGSGVCRDVDGWEQLRQHVPSDPHFAWKVCRLLRCAVLSPIPLSPLPCSSSPSHSHPPLLLLHSPPSFPLPSPTSSLLTLPESCGSPGAEGATTEAGEGGSGGQWEEVQGKIAEDVVVLLRRHRKQNRVIIPYIKVDPAAFRVDAMSTECICVLLAESGCVLPCAIAALLQADFFGSLSADTPASDEPATPTTSLTALPGVLVGSVEEELCRPQPTTSVPKMLAAVDLLCHLAAPLCSARQHALSTLLWLLAVRFPTCPSASLPPLPPMPPMPPMPPLLCCPPAPLLACSPAPIPLCRLYLCAVRAYPSSTATSQPPPFSAHSIATARSSPHSIAAYLLRSPSPLPLRPTVADMRAMLEANQQEPGGSEEALRERCADGMLPREPAAGRQGQR